MSLVECVGLLVMSYLLAIIIYQLYLMIQLMFHPARFRMEIYGEWALVTGCTDGIGKQYCLKMANQGCSKFILIGRNQQKLDCLRNEILKKFPNGKSEVETMVVDFASFTNYAKLKSYLSEKDIGVFINSVGVSYPLPQSLHQLDDIYPGLHWEHINVNLQSATHLTHIVLQGMEKRKRGLVIYISSGSSTQPTPMQSSYAGGKRMLDILAQNLQREYPNIQFQSIKPYYVATKLTQNKLQWKNFTTMIPSPEAYVEQALGTIGRFGTTHGYAPHCVQSWIVKIIPDFLLGPFVLRKMIKQRDTPR